MTCRELLKKLESELEKSGIKMTGIYGENNDCKARLVLPLENKLQVIEIDVKELCIWEGLKISEDYKAVR